MSSLFERLAFVVLVATPPALAHDRHGNAAMHQDVHVLLAKDHVEVTFQIETNEEGTFVEAIAMDANGDGKLSAEEQSAYFAQLDARLREGLEVTLNETKVALHPSGGVELSPPARKVFHFRGELPQTTSFPAGFTVYNDNFLDWPGRTALKVDAANSLMVELQLPTTTESQGRARLASQLPSEPTRESGYQVDWPQWSWKHRVLSPLGMSIAAIVLGLAACILKLIYLRSPAATITAVVLLSGTLASAYLAYATRGRPPSPAQAWPRQFRIFHRDLIFALAAYHRDGESEQLATHCDHQALTRLIGATRVADVGNDRSGTYELRRVRPIGTVVLKEPRYPLSDRFRVRHEWRVIGLMRHLGHPHERIRDFACEYTLRVTEHRLKVVDCSEWHQLPDEPIE